MEGRIKHALKLCGPGTESDKQKDVDPINISRAGMGLPANFGPRPQHIGKLFLQTHLTVKIRTKIKSRCQGNPLQKNVLTCQTKYM